MKSIQIPEELFTDLLKYFLLESDDPEIYARCVKGLKEKLDKAYRHHLYTKYHNKSLTDEEREAARTEYLDAIGMRKSFRW